MVINDPLINTPEPEAIIEPKNRFLAWLKGFFAFVVLLVIVFASFWVSFQLGKKIMVPVKRLPESRIQAVIPEPPPSIKALQQLEKAMGKSRPVPPPEPRPIVVKSREPLANLPVGQMAEKKLAQLISADQDSKSKVVRAVVFSAPTKSSPSRTETRRQSLIAKTIKPGPSGVYYKVHAGQYSSKAQAQAVAERVQAQGFEYFIRKDNLGWRVQVGAFRTQNEAAQLKASLAAAGFKAQIIKE